MRKLFLTARQVREAVQAIEGIRLPQRTLASWQAMGLVTPSVRWDKQKGRDHPTLWNLSDLARVRLIVRLRKHTGLTASRVRSILDYLDVQLKDAFHPRSKVRIAIIGPLVFVVPAGSEAPVEVTAPGQTVLFSVAELLEGNAEAAERVGARSVA